MAKHFRCDPRSPSVAVAHFCLVRSLHVRLHPSFLRGAAWILCWIIAIVAATYFWEGHHQHNWWSPGYLLTMVVPIALFIAFVCFMSVPSRLEFNDTHFIIQFAFRRVHTIPWDDLEYYGWLEGVYGLQFRSAGRFGFLPQALPRHEWKMLKSFLYTTFPERKASGFIGTRFFQWLWKKKKT